jgi:hypothetical protein
MTKKTKRKLRKLTSIMPMLEWRPDLTQTHMFRMPFKVGGMKDLQLHTPIKSRKKKVWANVYQKLCKLPQEIYMKDIEFGFMPYHNNMGWNVDEHKIVWTNQQIEIPLNEIRGLTLRGTAITSTEWVKTYNPYVKFNKFTIDILRNNKRVQMSLSSIVQSYKNSGAWDELINIKKNIWDIITDDTLESMWKSFKYYASNNNFIIPNPISSLRMTSAYDRIYFNFLLTKNTMTKHKLQNHISSTPKTQKRNEQIDEMNKRVMQRVEAESGEPF